RFLCLAPELRALGHGASLAGVLDLAVFGVIHGLAEAALRRLLVDLGAARLADTVMGAAHDIGHGFLAAHELANDRIDQAFVNERLEARRGFHGALSGMSPSAACDVGRRTTRDGLSDGSARRMRSVL